MSRHLHRLKNLILDRTLEEIEDKIEQREYKEALTQAAPLLAAGLGIAGLLVLALVLLYAGRGMIFKITVPILVVMVLFASYCENHKKTSTTSATLKPTSEQYVIVGNIVKKAAKRIAPILELTAIYEETDIYALKDEKIIQNGKCWLLKYCLPKKSRDVTIDKELFKRVLQKEIESVLESDNVGGFENIRYIYDGISRCIIQIQSINEGLAYIYLYCAIATDSYFQQQEMPTLDGHASSTDDEDF